MLGWRVPIQLDVICTLIQLHPEPLHCLCLVIIWVCMLYRCHMHLLAMAMGTWLCTRSLGLSLLLPSEKLNGILSTMDSHGSIMLHLLLLPTVSHVPIEVPRFTILFLFMRNLLRNHLSLSNLFRRESAVVKPRCIFILVDPPPGFLLDRGPNVQPLTYFVVPIVRFQAWHRLLPTPTCLHAFIACHFKETLPP